MRRWQLLLLIVGITAGLVGGLQTVTERLNETDYYQYYLDQDMQPVGKIGVFISYVVVPEEFREEDFVTIAGKKYQYMPWLVRTLMQMDQGIVLLDRERYYEFEEFEPTELVDHTGSSHDIDGVAYIDKYHAGEIEWLPPGVAYLSHGAFIYKGRKAGMSQTEAKVAVKARNFYYAPGKGSIDGRVPHEAGHQYIVFQTMERLEQKYGPLPWRWVTADNRTMARQALFSLLDEGIDTLIVAAPRPVYSDHEEFNGSIKNTMAYVREWQEENGNRPIKLIVSPQLSLFDPIYQTHTAILRDNLKEIPQGTSLKLVLSIHGMAWDKVQYESWLKLGPAYVERAMAEAARIMEDYDYKNLQIVQSQDHFADPVNDPENKYLSTNEAFWDGVRDGYDYVLNVPLEYFAENTDTMYYHDMANYDGFDDYSIYDTIEHTDWRIPRRKRLVQDGTTVIYGGVAAQQFSGPVIEAFYMTLNSIVSQGMQPLSPADDRTVTASAEGDSGG